MWRSCRARPNGNNPRPRARRVAGAASLASDIDTCGNAVQEFRTTVAQGKILPSVTRVNPSLNVSSDLPPISSMTGVFAFGPVTGDRRRSRADRADPQARARTYRRSASSPTRWAGQERCPYIDRELAVAYVMGKGTVR
jgi:hypothetical protein